MISRSISIFTFQGDVKHIFSIIFNALENRNYCVSEYYKVKTDVMSENNVIQIHVISSAEIQFNCTISIN